MHTSGRSSGVPGSVPGAGEGARNGMAGRGLNCCLIRSTAVPTRAGLQVWSICPALIAPQTTDPLRLFSLFCVLVRP